MQYAILVATLSVFGLISPWLVPIFNQYNRSYWVLDLIVHWQWFYTLTLLLSVSFLLKNNRKYVWLLIFLASPWLSGSKTLTVGETTKKLTIASANVHVSTQKVTALRNWLSVHNPEVVIVLEVSNALKNELASLKQYPYQVVESSDSPFGIALLSKFPLIKPTIKFHDFGNPHIETDVDFKGDIVSIYAFHPPPPLDVRFHQSRDVQLNALSNKIQDRQLPAIIAGDFNATPWSSAFKHLSTKSMRHVNISSTWPNWGFKIIGIPIDHIFASQHWLLSSKQVGDPIGSDHFPVIATLSLKESL